MRLRALAASHEACPLSAGLHRNHPDVPMPRLPLDITTGAVINGPATEPLGVYETNEQAGEIQVRI